MSDLRDMNINLQEVLKEKLRMKYKDSSILPFSDNAIIRGYFNDRSQWSPENIAAARVLNPNIPKMDIRLINGLTTSNEYFPEHFTNPMLQHILNDLDLVPTVADLEAIKARGLKIAVIGYGGAMINMLYNLTLWQHKLSVTGMFDRLIIFEKDNIETTNLMRLGKEVVFEYYPKIPGASEDVTALPKLMLLREEKELVKTRKPDLFNRWMTAEDAEVLHNNGYLFVGAPTFDARVFLEDKQFYFIGHGATEVDVTLAPKVNTSLGNETYGTIDIPVLLFNLQIATAAWIKHLASGATPALDTDIFRFDMATYLQQNPQVLELATQTSQEVA